MRLRISIIVLFFLLVPLFATSASLISAENVLLTKTETPALAQFYATGNSSQEVCSSGVYTDTVLLKNQGTLPDTYSITIEAADPLKDWIVVSDPVVSLAAGGEEQTISLYIKTPSSAQGVYSYKVLITSTYDDMQEIEKTIAAAPCATLTLKTFTPTQKACSCDVSAFLFELTNIGKAAEKYLLWLEGIDAASYDLSDSVVRLQPGERTTIYVYTRLPCGVSGTFPLTLKAQTSFSNTLTASPLSLEVLDCAENSSTAEKSDDSSALYILYTTYLFSTFVVLLLLAVLIVFVLFVKRSLDDRAARWLQQYQFLLPLCLSLFVLFLVIGAFAYPLLQQHYEQQEAIATQEETEASEDYTEEPLFTPWVTAVVLVGVLILLGVLTWYWKRRLCCTAETQEKHFELPVRNALQTSKKSEMKENKKWNGTFWSKETAAKAKPVLKWCWISLLLLLFLTGIGAGLYFFYIVVSDEASDDGDSAGEYEERLGETTSEENDDTLVALTESLADMDAKYKSMEEQLNELHDDINKIDEKINALAVLIEELQSQGTASDDLVANVQEEIEELQKEKDALEGALEEVQETAPVLATIHTEEIVQQPVSTQTYFKTVLIFDVSLSGQVEENGESRFSHGLELAKDYIEQDGRYTIMIVGKNAMILKRDISANIAIRLLRQLRPLDTQSNLGKGLYAAAEDIGQNPGRIVLVSDLITTDGSDIYDIREELIKEGLDIVFLTISSSEEVTETTETPKEVSEALVEEDTEISEASSEYPVGSEEESEEGEPSYGESEKEEHSDEEKTSQEPETAANEAASPVFDVESQAQGNFFIEIPKNTAYRIDLNTYFMDEDADPLVYTATAGEHLSATIEENFVTLTPETAWTGETWIQFTADDSNGGTVTSPAIRVIVSENDASPKKMNYIPWIILGSIIVLIIVSLISGAFAKKFHREPGMPPEEENE